VSAWSIFVQALAADRSDRINAILALSLSVVAPSRPARACASGVHGHRRVRFGDPGDERPLAAARPIATGVAAATIVAALLALPVRRLRGIFPGHRDGRFGEIVRVFANNLSITAARRDQRYSQRCYDPGHLRRLALVVLLLVLLARTKFGLAVTLVREDEYAARGSASTRRRPHALAGAGRAIAGLAARCTRTPPSSSPHRLRLRPHGNPGVVCDRRRHEPARCRARRALLSVLPELIRFLADTARSPTASSCSRDPLFPAASHRSGDRSGARAELMLALDDVGVRYGGVDACRGLARGGARPRARTHRPNGAARRRS